jgi:TonB family protein
MTFKYYLLDQPMRSKLFTAAVLLILPAFALRTATAAMLRIPEDEAKRSIVNKTAPSMPPIAKQVHITGKVLVDLTVSEDGSVEKVDVVSGNPVLSAAAVAAGKKWTFKPFQVDGKAEKALVRVTFDFGS